mmetsp:Transcript_15290/g.23164  ORF Transcript_15290/g.23164 Transcript_15290/m.23164 type:complete len:243 (+) Transcript_15290:38-766(+)
MPAQILDYGILLVPFGPAIVICILHIFPKRHLFVVAIASSAAYLISLAGASIFRLLVFPLRSSFWYLTFWSVLTQEIVRSYFIKYYFSTARRFSVIAMNAVLYPMQDLSSSFAAGIAWGITNAIMLYGDVLVRATGMATIVSPHCKEMSTPVLSSWASLLTIVIHTSIMIIAFDAYRRKNKLRIGSVVLLNFAHISLGGLNFVEGGCVEYLISEALLATFLVAVVFRVIHEDGYYSKRYAQD